MSHVRLTHCSVEDHWYDGKMRSGSMDALD